MWKLNIVQLAIMNFLKITMLYQLVHMPCSLSTQLSVYHAVVLVTVAILVHLHKQELVNGFHYLDHSWSLVVNVCIL